MLGMAPGVRHEQPVNGYAAAMTWAAVVLARVVVALALIRPTQKES
jgi:hypothetical protein